MTIALFDFDGTITTKDSLADFIQHAVGKFVYYCGLIVMCPTLVKYKLKMIPNHIAKEKLIAHFFKGWDAHHFQEMADEYSTEKIDQIVRPQAIEKIAWHQKEGHRVVVVSASMECWLKKWCEKQCVDLIATRLEIDEGKITGKFATKNCYGIEKVNRIKERYNLSEYDVIYAYGDSRGDKDMLSIASKQYYKPFE